MKVFNIGDVVWIARHGRQERHDPCPVCFGKLVVTVILGNGDEVDTPCSYCGAGFDGPRGWVTEYRIEPATATTVIMGRESREQQGHAPEITYHGLGCYCYSQAIVFATEGEALAESVKLCEKEIKEQEERACFIKKNKIKSFAWNVGYHLREAKRLRDQIGYHERMAVLCKAKIPAKNSGGSGE